MQTMTFRKIKMKTSHQSRQAFQMEGVALKAIW